MNEHIAAKPELELAEIFSAFAYPVLTLAALIGILRLTYRKVNERRGRLEK